MCLHQSFCIVLVLFFSIPGTKIPYDLIRWALTRKSCEYPWFARNTWRPNLSKSDSDNDGVPVNQLHVLPKLQNCEWRIYSSILHLPVDICSCISEPQAIMDDDSTLTCTCASFQWIPILTNNLPFVWWCGFTNKHSTHWLGLMFAFLPFLTELSVLLHQYHWHQLLFVHRLQSELPPLGNYPEVGGQSLPEHQQQSKGMKKKLIKVSLNPNFYQLASMFLPITSHQTLSNVINTCWALDWMGCRWNYKMKV